MSPQGLRILLLPLGLLAEAGHGVLNLLTMVGANAVRRGLIRDRFTLDESEVRNSEMAERGPRSAARRIAAAIWFKR